MFHISRLPCAWQVAPTRPLSAVASFPLFRSNAQPLSSRSQDSYAQCFLSKLAKKLERRKKPLAEVEADRKGDVVRPIVMQEFGEVPVEEDSSAGVPDVVRTAGEERAEDASNEVAVADLAGIGDASPTPRDDDIDSEDRTTGNILLSIAKPTSKVLEYVAEASGFAPFKVVAASLKFVVECRTAENKEDAQNLFSRLE
ncbi:hypothetical protein BC835DRAFT_1419920 [Cytidiella melzeri]|nr:hypothetical protein BC835DRAFT_1419920 [Cytidiella melzeri]